MGGAEGASEPRWSWPGGLQGDGDPAEQAGLRASGGEGQTDARGSFDDTGADFEEPEPQGGELGVTEGMGFGHRIADGEHQPIGGGMEDEADLVSERRAAAGAVGGELALVHLDQIFRLAAGAVDHVVDALGRASCEVGHDKANVEAAPVQDDR